MRPIRRAGLGASRITRRRFLVGGAAALSSTLLGCRPARDADRYDLCVIGSGFAGTHLALRAAERGLSTVLVEAGRSQSQAFGFRNRGPVDYPIDQTRFIGLGGGSNRWTGTVARLLPDDFRLRSRLGVEDRRTAGRLRR